MPKIGAVDVVDVRFPPAGDRCAVYVVLRTDTELAGHGISFTTSGTALCALAARRIVEPLVGRDVDELAGSLGDTYRRIVGDDRLRWMGPQWGIVRLAATAVLNAVWDLVARHAGKPLWRLVAEMKPADLVSACDFRYLSDALTPDEAVEMLERLDSSRGERIDHLTPVGYPSYVSVPGSGRADQTFRRRCREAVVAGWHAIKVDLGGNIADDKRRLTIAREELGVDGTLLLDADHMWDVPEAIGYVDDLAEFEPLWIGEPTAPDDVAGHAAIRTAVAPVGVAAGGHCHNRVMFKQLLRAGALDYCQLDPFRLGSVNEIVPVLLLAARYGVPVCPRAGDAGASELAQHVAIIDFVCVSGSLIGRLLEHVQGPHEHFTSPADVDGAWYRLPQEPGYSARMHAESVATYRYPDGTYWRRAAARR
jgi:L-fuconate dehydratase